jgi:hypothetical protein
VLRTFDNRVETEIDDRGPIFVGRGPPESTSDACDVHRTAAPYNTHYVRVHVYHVHPKDVAQ